jgi:hypothetical protein
VCACVYLRRTYVSFYCFALAPWGLLLFFSFSQPAALFCRPLTMSVSFSYEWRSCVAARVCVASFLSLFFSQQQQQPLNRRRYDEASVEPTTQLFFFASLFSLCGRLASVFFMGELPFFLFSVFSVTCNLSAQTFTPLLSLVSLFVFPPYSDRLTPSLGGVGTVRKTWTM